MKKVMILFIVLIIVTGCGKKELYCEEGILKDNNCEISFTEEASLSCAKGYKLKNGKCIKTETKNATKVKTCKDGYNLGGSICLSIKSYEKETIKKCVLPNGVKKTTYEMADGSAKISNKAYEESGKCFYHICEKKDESGKCLNINIKEIPYKKETICSAGMMEVDGRCYKTSKVKTAYVCYEGTLSKKKCKITKNSNVIAKCREGYTYNRSKKLCEKIITEEPLERTI